MHKKSEVLASFNVLGRRLLRDLLRQEALFSPPTCDIALSELQILSDVATEYLQFPSVGPNRILVELEPCISILLNWGKRDKESQRMTQPALLPSKKDSAQLLMELESHLRNALEIQKELLGRGAQSFGSYEKRVIKKRGKKYNSQS